MRKNYLKKLFCISIMPRPCYKKMFIGEKNRADFLEHVLDTERELIFEERRSFNQEIWRLKDELKSCKDEIVKKKIKLVQANRKCALLRKQKNLRVITRCFESLEERECPLCMEVFNGKKVMYSCCQKVVCKECDDRVVMGKCSFCRCVVFDRVEF